jgi:hypothetical protein
MDPSPTADATRFTLPERMSPTAKTRGRLVSRRSGARVRGQRARMAVAREELLQAQGPRGVPRSNERRVAESPREERDPPQDERAHEHLAQVGVALDHLSEGVTIEHQNFARRAHSPADEGPPPGEGAHLTGKLPSAEHGNYVVARDIRTHDLE